MTPWNKIILMKKLCFFTLLLIGGLKFFKIKNPAPELRESFKRSIHHLAQEKLDRRMRANTNNLETKKVIKTKTQKDSIEIPFNDPTDPEYINLAFDQYFKNDNDNKIDRLIGNINQILNENINLLCSNKKETQEFASDQLFYLHDRFLEEAEENKRLADFLEMIELRAIYELPCKNSAFTNRYAQKIIQSTLNLELKDQLLFNMNDNGHLQLYL